MGDINISNLTQTGRELFEDAKSFLEDLDDREINSVKGGVSLPVSLPPTSPSYTYCPPPTLTLYTKPGIF